MVRAAQKFPLFSTFSAVCPTYVIINFDNVIISCHVTRPQSGSASLTTPFSLLVADVCFCDTTVMCFQNSGGLQSTG